MDFLNIAKKVAGEIISEAVSQGARSQSGVKTSGKTVAQCGIESGFVLGH